MAAQLATVEFSVGQWLVVSYFDAPTFVGLMTHGMLLASRMILRLLFLLVNFGNFFVNLLNYALLSLAITIGCKRSGRGFFSSSFRLYISGDQVLCR